jgi:hypothetical protein
MQNARGDILKFNFHTIILMACVCASVSTGALYGVVAMAQGAADDTCSKRYWDTCFFPKINQLSNELLGGALDARQIKKDDTEVRIWVGFGLLVPTGLILRKENQGWTGHYLNPVVNDENITYNSIQVTPKSGWSRFSKKVIREGLIMFPDSEDLDQSKKYVSKGTIGIRDGVTYIVEYKYQGNYRRYHYVSPEDLALPEAMKFTELMKYIYSELDIASLYKVNGTDSSRVERRPVPVP